MDAETGGEIKKVRDAVHNIETIQSMIDVSAERLKGLRTQCLTSAELTQQEIRTLEGKLLKHFSKQLVIKAKFKDELQILALVNVPSLEQWLRVVGLGPDCIKSICSRVPSLEALRERSDHELRALLPFARDEEVRRLCRAMHRLRSYTEALSRGDVSTDMQLYWDSWERQRASPRARTRVERASVPGDAAADAHQISRNKGPSTPVSRRQQETYLPTPTGSLSKSRSHESQLSLRTDNEYVDGKANNETTPPSTPQEKPPQPNRVQHINASILGPLTPRTPTVSRCMAHDIAHRFTKSYSMLVTCDYCDKQIRFGTGLKCKECKFKCHRDCESKVPPSCGLPPEFIVAFKDKFVKDGYATVSPVPNRTGFLQSIAGKSKRKHHGSNNSNNFVGGPDSSSNTSSCNSSTPSSPALPPAPAQPTTPHHKHRPQFHFPATKPMASPNQTPMQSPARVNDRDKEDLTSSVKSSSASTDSSGARADSLDKGNDGRWPRQNSLSMKEWDIPYDELQLMEVIGTGRAGTVYRGSWHGAVAVKLLHVPALGSMHHIDTFKHEVATFRKTRHENLVLFMGACMKPPKLAIVTSLCYGMTLHTLLHLRKDKLGSKSVLIAQQISQGMGYLHARGIIHKDLKTKNIFLENGKVVITDFGLFNVTKLCFGNNARGDSVGIPAGWLCYLAPELVRALRPHASVQLPFSKASDVYAFGTVWYELLCGEWPFQGQPSEAVIWQVGKGVKQSLAHVQASRDIKDLLMLCWSYRPSDRPDFTQLLSTVQKLPRKRLARSPSHPVHLSRSADSVL